MDADPVAVDENLGGTERKVVMTTPLVSSQHTCKENANTTKGLPTIYLWGEKRSGVASQQRPHAMQSAHM